MAIVDKRRSALPVPFAMEFPDRVPKQRYFDPDFYKMEVDLLWSRTWQMACRLEEIPLPFDFTEYQILDQSIIVARTEDGGVRALQNVCRHRGVRVVEGRGTCESGFVCPFHGWCYGPDGTNSFVSRAGTFAGHNLQSEDLDLTPVRCEVWGGCAWINLDDDAPPLRPCIEPFATTLDAWKMESFRAEWWRAFRLPVNWKLAEEAFLEQYHVIQTHPQLVIPGRFPPRDPAVFDPQTFVESEIHYLRTMSDGMAGMVHANDVRIAESLRDIDLPADPTSALATWQRTLNDAVVRWHRDKGCDIPDLNQLEAAGLNQPMGYCFPHFFVLPMYSSASCYRFRPLGPEQTLMEIWSLTRFPEGSTREKPSTPGPMDHDDPRVPPIPVQDFSNLPRQQRGLHAKSFEYMRLSEGIEGGIANFERTVDGFLAGLPYEKLLPALHQINLNPLERPVVDLGFCVRLPKPERSAPMDYACVAEGIRATLAAYAQALDDGRTDDIVATFCPDGVCEIPGLGTHQGHDALRQAFGQLTPVRPQRHVVVNTHVTDWNAEEASASSDLIFLLKGKEGWSVQLVGRYHDVLRQSEGTWRFHRRTAEFIT